MRIASTVFLTAFLLAAPMATGDTLPASITSTTELSASGSPWVAAGDVAVTDGAILKAGPGVRIELPAGASLLVDNGSIDFQGSSSNPVTVTGVGGATWGTICVKAATADVFVRHAVISKGSFIEDCGDIQRAALSVVFTEKAVTIENVRFEENIQGVHTSFTGKVIFRDNYFAASNSGEGVNIKSSAGAVCEGNQFFDVFDADAIDYDTIDGGVIRNNLITGSTDDCLDVGSGSNDILVENNEIYNCSDKGISIGENSTNIDLNKNIIYASDIGVAVKDGSDSLIRNNTIYDVTTGVDVYEKIPPAGGGTVVVNSTIISNASGQNVQVDSKSTASVLYTLTDDESLPGTGNKQGNPAFMNAGGADFSLNSNSPAIDSGDPGNLDPDNTRSDIGAVYFPQSSSATDNPIINEINYKSAVGLDVGDWVELYNPNAEALDISGWTLKGEGTTDEYTFPSGTSIPANGYLVAANELPKFEVFFPGVTSLPSTGVGLMGTGEKVSLLNVSGAVVDEVPIGVTSPWPTEPAGTGFTLSLKATNLDNAEGSNWERSDLMAGSPGADNDANLPGGAPSSVFISEINYNSSPSFDPGDWVEFHNDGGSAVDMSGWYFRDGDDLDVYLFPDGTSIAAGGYLVLVRSRATFDALYSGVSNIKGDMGFAFNVGGEALRLYAKNSTKVDEVSFGTTSPWPVEANGVGATLELKNVSSSTDNGNGSNWQASKPDGGTPGAANSEGRDSAGQATPLVITELIYDPPAGFASGDWVEIHNPNSSSVDLSGWKFQGAGATQELVFTNGASIAAGAYMVLVQDKDLFAAIYPDVSNVYLTAFNFDFDNGGQLLRILDADGKVSDQVAYANSSPWPTTPDAGYSLSLKDTGDNNEQASNWRGSQFVGGDPGVKNNFSTSTQTPPAVVINEINYKSALDADSDDWVEFYNASTSTVDMSGWYIRDSVDGPLFRFSNGTTLASGAYLVVYKDAVMFEAVHGNVSNAVGGFSFGLSSLGDQVRLFSHQSVLVDSVDYGVASPWPSEPNGTGKTLILVDADLDNSSSSNWNSSQLNGGSPGSRNPSSSTSADQDRVDLLTGLRSVYPNPVSGETAVIDYGLETGGVVHIEVFDALGRRVASVDNRTATAGNHSSRWETDGVGPGIYFVRMSLDGANIGTRRLVVGR